MTDSTTASASMPVMAAGTQTAMRGLKMRERQTWLTNRTISSFVMRWSWMMPSRSGRTKSMCAGARPTIFNASSPTARMEFVRVSTAPMVGWRNTTPCSSVAMIMEVVPRSIPMSYCFMDSSPLVKYRRSIASMPLRTWLSRQPQPPCGAVKTAPYRPG